MLRQLSTTYNAWAGSIKNRKVSLHNVLRGIRLAIAADLTDLPWNTENMVPLQDEAASKLKRPVTHH